MIPDQRHNSDPFVCHNNLHIGESAACLRRGSASLVKTMSPSPFLCPSLDLGSTNSTGRSVQATDSICSTQNPSVLSPLQSTHQHSDHDSASHFSSPLLPLDLQPPSELHLSVPRSPQPKSHCKACMSLLLWDRTKGGGSLGGTPICSFSASTQFPSVSKPGSTTSPHLSSSSPVTLPPSYSSPSPPLSNSLTTPLTSRENLSPPSQVLPRNLYEGSDLTLLNHCLHHIVSRRTSTPTLSERALNHPKHSHVVRGGTTSSVFEHLDKSQSLEVPLFRSPNLDRNLLLLPHNSKGRPDPLVGLRRRLILG